jgi:hypothetical protein
VHEATASATSANIKARRITPPPPRRLDLGRELERGDAPQALGRGVAGSGAHVGRAVGEDQPVSARADLGELGARGLPQHAALGAKGLDRPLRLAERGAGGVDPLVQLGQELYALARGLAQQSHRVGDLLAAEQRLAFAGLELRPVALGLQLELPALALALPLAALALLLVETVLGARAVALGGPDRRTAVHQRSRVVVQVRQPRRGAEHEQVDQPERERADHWPDVVVATDVDQVPEPHQRDHGDRRDRQRDEHAYQHALDAGALGTREEQPTACANARGRPRPSRSSRT